MRIMLLVFAVAACAPSPQGPVHAPGAPTEASPMSVATGGSTPEPRSGWFCWVDHKPSKEWTGCARTLDECNTLEQGARNGDAGPSWDSCAPRDRAFCFSYRERDDQTEVEECFANPSECGRMQEYLDATASNGDKDLDAVAGSVTACAENP
jgi:hypothetical protein